MKRLAAVVATATLALVLAAPTASAQTCRCSAPVLAPGSSCIQVTAGC